MDAVPPKKLSALAAEAADEEVDVWWGGYSWRALLPGFLVCALVTPVIMGGVWYLVAWRGIHQLKYSADAIVVVLWLVMLWRWAYRVFGSNYRLTTRRLFRDHGFRHPGDPAVDLARVSQVIVVRRPWERLVGIGRILIRVEKDPNPPLILAGIRGPEWVAMLLREQVHRCRDKG